jgi:hypothetical protein
VLQELLYGLVLAFEYFGGLPRKLLFDYVTDHIIEVLCPDPLCGGGWWLCWTGGVLRVRPGT